MPPQIPNLPLRDIHIPNAINHFPPAIGWWILIFATPIVLFAIYWLIKFITRKTPIKLAKQQLQLISTNNQSDLEKIIEISILIRRTAISVHSRTKCASLAGIKWLEFLDQSMHDTEFTQGIGKCLEFINYQKTPPKNINVIELIQLTQRWITAQKKYL